MIKTGDVIKIKLLNIDVFSFVKYYELNDINKNYEPSPYIRVFNYFYNTNDSMTLNHLAVSKYFYQPMLIYGIIPTLKNRNWKVIGNLPLNKIDKQVPTFKRKDIFTEKWGLQIGSNINDVTNCNYKEIEHLERSFYNDYFTIEVRLTILYYLENNLDFTSKTLNLDEETFNYNYKEVLEIYNALHNKMQSEQSDI